MTNNLKNFILSAKYSCNSSIDTIHTINTKSSIWNTSFKKSHDIKLMDIK